MLDLFRPTTTTTKPLQARPRPHVKRRSKRFSVPVFDIPIRVDLLASGVRYPCHLWDVSEHGACLLLRSPVTPRQEVVLRIHAPNSSETIDLTAQLMWTDAVMGSYYAGVEFSHPMDFGPTFLGALIRNADTISRTSQLAA